VKLAIRKHLRDFIAILALFVVGMGVAAYIVSNQRLYLPGWVPGIGTEFYVIEAEFSTAQAVVPGQGQTVNIAGVPVGEIGEVNLRGGVAVVTLKIREKHAPIYKDSTMLLRPKTGLKDMIVEMDPGTKEAGELEEGGVIPVTQTSPDVNLDEILAALDGDTRSYLTVLLTAGGQAFRTKEIPTDLRQTFKRFEPLARDAELITAKLKDRRENLKRVIHNFRLLTEELGKKDTQLAELVDSSNANFKAFAAQDQNIQAALRELPPTLQQAETTLTKVTPLANQLGETSEALRPFARELGPTLVEVRPFLRQTTPIIRDQLRPFAREARPAIRELEEVASKLEPTTPRLIRTFRVVNSLLNTLAYNPPGDEEGYLFWASWVNHAGASIFGTQDAHGPIRRGSVIVSCSSLQLLENVTATNPPLELLFQLLGAPDRSQVCPGAIPPGVPETTPKDKAEKEKPKTETRDGGADSGKPVTPAQPEGKPATSGKPVSKGGAGK
jgi:phospholipid/cholesterol/gamma-HCH transport system substrate-binding protein